ncbi:hypothetical protein HYQ45_015660 [Verticillium longisporum]|uniref:Uncharacterized protein n=3 Tax=Verticillium TaxID=1036719 RepID=G2X3W8_VERDV|nr:uncharacterized protein VDAG_04705 [Verticillium dahliae VdLs.17]KAF3346051.1 hypothetical protein VdG2_05886 [Verticillium dahliae VDG2]KAF3356972.1 hypothetical protein VdG1_03530 [Verticillium dahliae VDG1]KAG7118039.1 hypothetical protein HYQ45_015660 [Verticillium longisporum]KAH6691855.1 hypothetical protein EV126DRAFT_525284 [Verticillium dahliae]EGY23267.1 hypothetical protein VDAG_04705 [Verticillium dahliae VdLs.17]
MQLTYIATSIAILAIGQASTIPVRRQDTAPTFANVGDACSVGREDGECDKFGRCVQFIPPNEQSVLNQGRTVDTCTQIPDGEAEVGFGNSFNGEGEPLFGNAGVACTVGNEDGECDQFGRCSQFIPPNEQSILNQGRPVDTCTAGGQVGTLKH